MKQRRPSKCIKKTSWFMLYSGILYINSKISPKNVRYKRSTKVARARKVVERSLLSSKGPEAPVLHEGRARARARARALSTRDIFDRPKKSINEFLNSFFEIGKNSTRSCQQSRQKTKNSKKICEKNSSQKSQNFKLRHNFKLEICM